MNETAQQPSILAGFVPIIGVFVIFYFLIIKPQQKKAKEKSQMLDELKVGTKVVLSCGIIGTIVEIQKEAKKVILTTYESTKLEVTRDSISDKVN